MSDEITNVQTPDATPVPPAGPSVEELQAKIAELERAREGILRDKQREVEKRQELEARLSSPAPSPANQDVTDELGKVLDPYNRPIKQKAEEAFKIAKAMQTELEMERAKTVLSTKTGKRWEELEADKAFTEKMVSIATRYQLAGPADSVAKRAYEIYELEELKAKEADRVRAANAARNASIPSGSAPVLTTSQKVYSAEEFERLPAREFASLSKDGDFKKVDGKFVYSPRS